MIKGFINKGVFYDSLPSLGYESVYLPLCEVADTPFHIHIIHITSQTAMIHVRRHNHCFLQPKNLT